MTEREQVEILRQLREDYWRPAWIDMKRCGVMAAIMCHRTVTGL